MADFAFALLCSSKTKLQTATHSLQMQTRLERSDGFEMSASTSSWVLLQKEHLGISCCGRRWPNINLVWRESSRSQDPQSSNWRGSSGKALQFSNASEDAAPWKPKDCLLSNDISGKLNPQH